MESGVVSTQVLQELFVSLTKKIPRPVDLAKARTIVEDLCAWEVVVNDEQAVLAAIDLQAKYQLSFWDSLILDAARRSGATTLYSEDLSTGQRVGEVAIVNPFEI
jgi:predicted nucleic acid-binding protein